MGAAALPSQTNRPPEADTEGQLGVPGLPASSQPGTCPSHPGWELCVRNFPLNLAPHATDVLTPTRIFQIIRVIAHAGLRMRILTQHARVTLHHVTLHYALRSLTVKNSLAGLVS